MPLLNRRTIVCPLIDVINDETFEYAAGTCLVFCNTSLDFHALLILLFEHKLLSQ